MTHNRKLLSLAAVAGLAGLLASCSSSSSSNGKTSAPKTTASSAVTSSSSTTAVTTTPAASTGKGACKYVTTAQASALAGSPVKAGVSRSLTTGPVPFEYCDYIFDPGNAPGVSVAVAKLNGNGPSLFAQYRASEQDESDYQIVQGVGDEAFFAGESLNVRKGDTGLILFVGRTNSLPRGPEGIPDEKSLAAIVLPQL
jgi:hypothetical protein